MQAAMPMFRRALPWAMKWGANKAFGVLKRRVFKKRKFEKKVRKAIGYNPEFKYLDTKAATFYTPQDANGALHYCLVCLNEVGQGTDYDERIGRSLVGKWIQVHIIFRPPTTAANCDWMRVVLFYDKTPSAALPTTTAIVDQTVTTDSAMAFKKLSSTGPRFRIVYDWLSPCLQIGSENPSITINYKIPQKWDRSTYNTDATAIPITGGWFLMVTSLAQTGAAATSADYYYTSRFAFNEE